MTATKLEVIIGPHRLTLTVESTGVSIGINGYHEKGGGDVIFIEMIGEDNEHPQVYIFDDINDEEPSSMSLRNAHWENDQSLLYLECPSCKVGRDIEVVLGDATTSDTVSVHQTDDGGWLEYHDNVTVHGGQPRFQCLVCGYVIQENGSDISDEEELIEWLKNQ